MAPKFVIPYRIQGKRGKNDANDAANIRETFRERPGARVLAIVGVSHKPWFDAWLGQLQGVDIADTAALLK